MSDVQKAPVKDPKADQKFESAVDKMGGSPGKFAQELWKVYRDITNSSYDYNRSFSGLHNAYTELCGHSARNADVLDEFWNPKYTEAIEKLFDRDEARVLHDICELIVEAPYAHDIYRPSYRSHRAGDYVYSFFMALVHAIDYNFYELKFADIMRKNYTEIPGFENRLALALRRNDKEIGLLTREAILGESGEIKLSNPIIRGVIKSGVPEYLELLGKLLLAAKGQEGVRQAILENADCGTVQSHAYFIKLMIDNNLSRFSSVIRAFGTWTGLAYDNAKPAVIDKCIKLAYTYLRDGSIYEDGLKSADTLEVYMALWARASRDIYAAKDGAERLVDVPEKYRRLVGWYFLCSTIHKKIIHDIAIQHIDVREPEELAWICSCLYQDSDALRIDWQWETKVSQDGFPNAVFPESFAKRQAQFNKLCAVMDFIGNKKIKFDGGIFPWMGMQLEANDVAKCALGIAGYDKNPGMILKLSEYLPVMDAELRRAYYINLIDPSYTDQRGILLAGLSDKSLTVKGDIVKRLSKEDLHRDDIEYLTGTLTTQNAGLRKAVMSLMDKQPENLIRPVIFTLLHSDNEKQLLAGVELLGLFGEKNVKLAKEFEDKVAALKNRANLPKDIAILLSRYNSPSNAADYTTKNGYGLYNLAFSDFDKNIWVSKRPNVTIYGIKELASLLDVNDDELCSVLLPIRDVLLIHKDMECETEYYGGSKFKVLIGDNNYWLPLRPGAERKAGTRSIYEYYLADEIMAAVAKADISSITIAKILCYGFSDFKKEFTPEAIRIFSGLPFDEPLNFDKYIKPLSGIVGNILRSVLESKHDGVFEFALSAWKNLVEIIPNSEVLKPYQTKSTANYYPPRNETECMFRIDIIAAWKDLAHRFIETDEQFAAFWNETWYEYLITGKKFIHVHDHLDLLRAYKLRLLSENGLYYELVSGANAADHMQFFTKNDRRAVTLQKQIKEDYPFFTEFLATVIDHIVTVEEKRGELPTQLTPVAACIGRFSGGVKHFSALITALGKDNFHRGYSWYSHGHTKQTTLSVLLKNCYPSSDDTTDGLKSALKSSAITQKRLLQAVMYAPQWADLAEKATGITGLSSAVWLFHAHINEQFSAEKETKVALYSPVSQQQFTDGTFDKDWFLEAYHAVGENIFNELYKNAKYITESGSAHRRSQIYTDAALGRLDKVETEIEITEKRNQEKLRAYALIPLDVNNSDDALSRYEFIQKYAKESKQYGAQRQASEKKAVLIALQNLALTTGFRDTDRMAWYLESEKMDSLRPLMEAREVGTVSVWLSFDKDGNPSLGVLKEGKALQSLPKAYAQNETVLEIQTAVKDLKDQKKRAKLSFEMAMVSRTAFGSMEIKRLMKHPVLSDMIRSLAFVSNGHIGFPGIKDDVLCLTSPDGTEINVHDKDALIIAHPYDLMANKCWSIYQQYLYKNQMIQPFKQVFREYYPVTEDEKAEVNISRRYAGHQVQPQKTIALLKTRGWTAEYEDGLQRVYHKEKLVACMYALADWFSPADIEAPTLEVVRFFSRDKNEPLPLIDVPPVIFSEVMRDIDLVVSVAHVGGVDPEASHSTVEMRIAIAKELLSLLSIKNVTFQTAHAQIKGSMGDYSVHMGSGVVHQNGVGMLAVLPVHSQARGRIFLPFSDNDPKTAEIMSKILLFAEDKKIKDPAILSQINA